MTDHEQIALHLPDEAEPGRILEQLDAALKATAVDTAYRESMHTVVPGAGQVLGVRVPQLRALAAQLGKAYRGQETLLLDLARGCWRRGTREHRLIALFLLAGMKALTPRERWSMAEGFLPDVQDWETCDQLCGALTGQALAEDPAYMDQLEVWAGDPDFWVRRVAIVSTVLLRRSAFELGVARSLDERTLELCDRLLADEEKYIRTAVDWALRELIKRSYKLGCGYLIEKAAERPDYPARATLKLAAKKLKPADQDRFFEALEA
jgi:3-methyladenine DNA glycosylase AlkD